MYFPPPQFLGGWYVIRKTDTTSSCLKNEYLFHEPSGEYRILETRDWFVLDRLGIDTDLAHEGKLDFFHGDQARMRVKFNLNMAGKADYLILDTDYKNFAVVYECQDLVNFLGLVRLRRRSGALLVRDLAYDNPTVVEKSLRRLKDLGVSTDVVAHEGCANPKFKFTADEQLVKRVTETVRGVGEAVDTAVKDVGKGIEKVLKDNRHVLNGAEDVFTGVVEGVRRVFAADSAPDSLPVLITHEDTERPETATARGKQDSNVIL
ncbi:unnamed protein product [Darwinula stevensoni]|uniref:Uncharacterized protein n=1 Tax=Darwinula stevensoni TaxID=69355 RepID=A0A7R9AEM3_9CRUS|nr:unnamed protein product [Darwinula stevensoni]CAG0902508.1 unnamed protein product [Darwinula stevensoni]